MEPIRGKTEIIDPFYRYKMEKMVFRIERTKTSIMNLDKIALSLKIPDPECIIIFFKKRLAMQMAQGNQGLIISRHVDSKIMQDALYEFIDYFVLCKSCSLPELTYATRNKHFIADCASCGTTNEIKINQYTEPVIKHMKTLFPDNSKNQIAQPDDQSMNDGVKKKKKKEKKKDVLEQKVLEQQLVITDNVNEPIIIDPVHEK